MQILFFPHPLSLLGELVRVMWWWEAQRQRMKGSWWLVVMPRPYPHLVHNSVIKLISLRRHFLMPPNDDDQSLLHLRSVSLTEAIHLKTLLEKIYLEYFSETPVQVLKNSSQLTKLPQSRPTSLFTAAWLIRADREYRNEYKIRSRIQINPIPCTTHHTQLPQSEKMKLKMRFSRNICHAIVW